MPPKNVLEILHCPWHLAEDFLATFVTQMKSEIGEKVLLVPAALGINLGELGARVVPRLLGNCSVHCFPWEVVGRVERGRGRQCGRQKSFQKRGVKKRALKSYL